MLQPAMPTGKDMTSSCVLLRSTPLALAQDSFLPLRRTSSHLPSPCRRRNFSISKQNPNQPCYYNHCRSAVGCVGYHYACERAALDEQARAGVVPPTGEEQAEEEIVEDDAPNAGVQQELQALQLTVSTRSPTPTTVPVPTRRESSFGALRPRTKQLEEAGRRDREGEHMRGTARKESAIAEQG